ncbi:hypothetical protein HWV62_15084, partial [Athelia sp. TMB]
LRCCSRASYSTIHTPSTYAGGTHFMILPSPSSRQPIRAAWTRERLVYERAIALGSAIDPSTVATYTSALQSYLTFCRSHNFPIDPSPDTLSLYTVFMSHHINPKSVASYLSGIANQLEPFFPDVRTATRSPLVSRTLRGCKKLRAVGVHRKRPLRRHELAALRPTYVASSDHDDLLFISILLTGFFGLMRLGELVYPDKRELKDPRKVIPRDSVELLADSYSFFLPGHKADRFFEGNRVIIQRSDAADDPLAPFKRYLASRDTKFPFHQPLWIRGDGSIPTRSWFISRLRTHFPSRDVSGHSLRAGGATALAEAGVPAHIIQAIGRWASETFQIYIRQHPVLLAALMYGPRPPAT